MLPGVADGNSFLEDMWDISPELLNLILFLSRKFQMEEYGLVILGHISFKRSNI